MKKFISILICLVMVAALPAQSQEKMSVNDFFKKYSGTPGTESSMLGSEAIRTLLERPGLTGKTKKLLKNLDRIWAISASSDNREFVSDVQLTVASRKDYRLTRFLDRDGRTIAIYLSGKRPSSLVMITEAEGRTSFLEIRGEFSLLDVESLTGVK